MGQPSVAGRPGLPGEIFFYPPSLNNHQSGSRIRRMPDAKERKQEGAEPLVGIEIERKYLLDRYPTGIEDYPYSDVRQGYLISGNGLPSIRVREERTSDGKTFLYETIKSNKRSFGMARDEVTIPLTPDQFSALWGLTEGKRVVKRRYFVPLEYFTGTRSPYVVHLDIYEKQLEGLVTAELEFLSLTEAEAFKTPKTFGREVTRVSRYSNSKLAVYGIPPGTRLFRRE
jgi:adenylate cyclase